MYCVHMGEANVEALRRGYAALNRGDLSVVLELLDPEIEWHEPAPSLEGGAHRGRDSFERFLRGWLESFDDFRVEPERVVERGDAGGKAVRWESVQDLDAAVGDGG